MLRQPARHRALPCRGGQPTPPPITADEFSRHLGADIALHGLVVVEVTLLAEKTFPTRTDTVRRACRFLLLSWRADAHAARPTGRQARGAGIGAPLGLMAPGGTLLAIARAADGADAERDPAMMPRPLTRSELEAVTGNLLTMRCIEKFLDDEDPPSLR